MKRFTTQVVTVGLVGVTALGMLVASRARTVTVEINRVQVIDSEIWVDATLQNCSASILICDTQGPSGPLVSYSVVKTERGWEQPFWETGCGVGYMERVVSPGERVSFKARLCDQQARRLAVNYHQQRISDRILATMPTRLLGWMGLQAPTGWHTAFSAVVEISVPNQTRQARPGDHLHSNRASLARAFLRFPLGQLT